MVNYVTRYLENKLKPELGHKTGSKANFEKICHPELRLEERITCAKFQKIWPYKNTKVGVGFAGTAVIKIYPLFNFRVQPLSDA